MFNVSWGELAVLAGISVAVIGRRDLPKVAFMVGTQVGRVVGLLQGARARADRFAAQSELKQLQNELRSGLRELDAVKSELAVSMSPSAMIGRTLGPMTSNVDNNISRASTMQQQQQQTPTLGMSNPTNNSIMASGMGSANNATAPSPLLAESSNIVPSSPNFMSQSNIHQSSLAVAEQVWDNQGIGFSSAAERGVGLSSSNAGYNRDQAGSVILSKLLQESLIFDQYDRIVAEQNATLQSKVTTIQEKYEASKMEIKNEKREKREAQ
jgi:Sec-independent protein translocase protein TatA